MDRCHYGFKAAIARSAFTPFGFFQDDTLDIFKYFSIACDLSVKWSCTSCLAQYEKKKKELVFKTNTQRIKPEGD